MRKTFKYVGIFLASILVLVVLATLMFIFLFNPNDYKPLITSQLKKYIHREIIINGNLSWTFFPDAGIKVGHMIILDPADPEKSMVVEISNTTIDINLRALLHKKLEILGVNITNAIIHWKDAKTHQSYEIKNADFHAKNLDIAKDFPAAIRCDFKKSNLLVHMDIKGIANIDPAKQTFIYRDITGKIAEVPIAGTINVTNLSADPVTKGHMLLKSFDLKKTLKSLGQDASSIQEAKNTQGNLDFSIDKQGARAQGAFTMDALQVNDLNLNKINMQMHFQKGVLALNPITASLYQGTLQSQVRVDLNGAQPVLAVNTQLNNIQTEPLLHDLTKKDEKLTVASMGNISIQITSAGADKKTILRNMNGAGKFNLSNGVLKGIDLTHLIDSAFSLIKKQVVTSKDTEQTNFNSLTGTLNIRNGILLNEDMVLDAPTFETKGRGKIDLPSSWINYVLYMDIKKQAVEQTDDLANLYGIAIPVAIRGSLTDPSITLDAGELMKAIAKSQVGKSTEKAKEEVKNQIKEQIEKNVPGAAGQLLQEFLKR